MSEQIMNEIRERIAKLEASFKVEGSNTKETLNRILEAQNHMLTVMQEIAVTQGKMEHIGSAIDENSREIGDLKKTVITQGKVIEKHKVLLAGGVFVSGAAIVAWMGDFLP